MRRLSVLAGCVVLAASGLLAEKTHAPKIEAARIRDAVKYLSSDSLEGRGTGQKGGDAAAAWIAEQFKSYGLKPAGANGRLSQLPYPQGVLKYYALSRGLGSRLALCHLAF